MKFHYIVFLKLFVIITDCRVKLNVQYGNYILYAALACTFAQWKQNGSKIIMVAFLLCEYSLL